MSADYFSYQSEKQGAGRQVDPRAAARTKKATVPARDLDAEDEPMRVQEHTASTSIVRALKAAALRRFETDKRS